MRYLVIICFLVILFFSGNVSANCEKKTFCLEYDLSFSLEALKDNGMVNAKYTIRGKDIIRKTLGSSVLFVRPGGMFFEIETNISRLLNYQDQDKFWWTVNFFVGGKWLSLDFSFGLSFGMSYQKNDFDKIWGRNGAVITKIEREFLEDEYSGRSLSLIAKGWMGMELFGNSKSSFGNWGFSLGVGFRL
jgi:hypothetical protein